jgi:hypothetical protein
MISWPNGQRSRVLRLYERSLYPYKRKSGVRPDRHDDFAGTVYELASFTFLTPLFGVIAGGVLLNEPITGSLVLALVLVGMGIFLVNRPNAG